MSSGRLSDQNSQKAAEYAAKKKEQLVRANRLRMERESNAVSHRLSTPEVSADRAGEIVETGMHFGSAPMDGVVTSSYKDRFGAPVAERIIIKREAYGRHDPWEAPEEYPPAPAQALSIAAPPRSLQIAPSSSRSRAAERKVESTSSVISDEFLTIAPRLCHALRADSQEYFNAPADPAGSLVDVSNMPILCMSSNLRDEIIVGSADHALYAININAAAKSAGGPPPRSRNEISFGPPDRPSGRDSRSNYITMYGKKHGHTDWVTGVCHLVDGRVLSCGMDNKLCLWNTSRTTCTELMQGHERSVSKVIADSIYNVALSCYDGNVMAWAFGGSDSNRRGPAPVRGPAAVLYGHQAPVVECTFKGPTVAAGTKEGNLFFWDLPAGALLNKHRAHKNGPVTAIDSIDNSPLFLSGGADGVLKVWDPRSSSGGKGSVSRIDAHASSSRSTTAAVTALACLSGVGGGPLSHIVSGGADGNLVVTDCRKGGSDSAVVLLNPSSRWDHHRAPVSSISLAGSGGCVFSADGAGMVMCYDVLGADEDFVVGKGSRAAASGGAGLGLRYGLSASSRGGVRATACLEGKLICGGDDGKVLIYRYS
jgi:WD40 repeat protein